MVNSWREYQSKVFPAKTITYTNKAGEVIKVKVIFLLFMANDLDDDNYAKVTCTEQEGIAKVKGMRSWLPTAA